MCLECDFVFSGAFLMSGACSDEKPPHESSEKIRRTEIFALGIFHSTTLCLSSPSRQILLSLLCLSAVLSCLSVSVSSVSSVFVVQTLRCRNPVNTLAISLSCDP